MESTVASEIMTREILSAREDMTVEEALKILVNSRITGMPVVDAKGRMIGVVSEFDLLQQISRHKRLKPQIFQEPIEFSRKADSVREDASLKDVVHAFIEKKFRRLPVLDAKGRLVGIITRRDLIRIYYYRAALS